MIVVDTNVISEALKPNPNERVLRRLDDAWPQTFISAISLGELWEGVRRLSEGRHRNTLEAAVSDWLELLPPNAILPFGEEESRFYADLRAASFREGRPIGIPDAMIAATCLVHNAVLYTRNIKDFESTGIKLVNPWEK